MVTDHFLVPKKRRKQQKRLKKLMKRARRCFHNHIKLARKILAIRKVLDERTE